MNTIPKEPEFQLNVDTSVASQLLDLRDDLDEMQSISKNQWTQFCMDMTKTETMLSDRIDKIKKFCYINIGVSGGLLCLVLTMLLT